MGDKTTGIDDCDGQQLVYMLWLKYDKYCRKRVDSNEHFIDHPCAYLVKITGSQKMYRSDYCKQSHCSYCGCAAYAKRTVFK